jgi:hypothetical protein
MNVLAIIFLVGTLGYLVGLPIYASLTEGSSDRADIRAKYEGLTGAVGPNATVVSIGRAGISLAGNGRRGVYRRYEVVIARHNGQRVNKSVGVPVGPFNSGEVEEII